MIAVSKSLARKLIAKTGTRTNIKIPEKSPKKAEPKNHVKIVRKSRQISNDTNNVEKPPSGIKQRGRIHTAPDHHRDACQVFETVIFTQPRVKGRHRTNTSGSYTPAKTAAFERYIKAEVGFAMRQFGPGFEYPLEINLVLMFKSDSNDIWPVAQTDGDLSNLVKSVEDAINKVAYRDDRLITISNSAKICGPRDAIFLRVMAARHNTLVRDAEAIIDQYATRRNSNRSPPQSA